MLCYKCRREIADNSLVCPNCGAEMSVFARRREGFGADGYPPYGAGNVLPMNWYKVLVFFILFFEAVQYIFTGISYITGYISKIPLGSEGYVVYSFSLLGGGFKWVDIIYGVLMIGLAGFALYSRFRLAKFRSNAMWIYLSYLIAGGILSAAYSTGYLIATGESVRVIIASLTSLIPQGLLVYFNYIYFNKRKHLFRG